MNYFKLEGSHIWIPGKGNYLKFKVFIISQSISQVKHNLCRVFVHAIYTNFVHIESTKITQKKNENHIIAYSWLLVKQLTKVNVLPFDISPNSKPNFCFNIQTIVIRAKHWQVSSKTVLKQSKKWFKLAYTKSSPSVNQSWSVEPNIKKKTHSNSNYIFHSYKNNPLTATILAVTKSPKIFFVRYTFISHQDESKQDCILL